MFFQIWGWVVLLNMFFYADRMWRATNVGTSAFEVIDGIEVNQLLGLFLKISKIFKSLIKKSLFNKRRTWIVSSLFTLIFIVIHAQRVLFLVIKINKPEIRPKKVVYGIVWEYINSWYHSIQRTMAMKLKQIWQSVPNKWHA